MRRNSGGWLSTGRGGWDAELMGPGGFSAQPGMRRVRGRGGRAARASPHRSRFAVFLQAAERVPFFLNLRACAAPAVRAHGRNGALAYLHYLPPGKVDGQLRPGTPLEARFRWAFKEVKGVQRRCRPIRDRQGLNAGAGPPAAAGKRCWYPKGRQAGVCRGPNLDIWATWFLYGHNRGPSGLVISHISPGAAYLLLPLRVANPAVPPCAAITPNGNFRRRNFFFFLYRKAAGVGKGSPLGAPVTNPVCSSRRLVRIHGDVPGLRSRRSSARAAVRIPMDIAGFFPRMVANISNETKGHSPILTSGGPDVPGDPIRAQA